MGQLDPSVFGELSHPQIMALVEQGIGNLAWACIRVGLSDNQELPDRVKSALEEMESKGPFFASIASLLRRFTSGNFPDTVPDGINQQLVPVFERLIETAKNARAARDP